MKKENINKLEQLLQHLESHHNQEFPPSPVTVEYTKPCKTLTAKEGMLKADALYNEIQDNLKNKGVGVTMLDDDIPYTDSISFNFRLEDFNTAKTADSIVDIMTKNGKNIRCYSINYFTSSFTDSSCHVSFSYFII